jgi:hypothetical protein
MVGGHPSPFFLVLGDRLPQCCPGFSCSAKSFPQEEKPDNSIIHADIFQPSHVCNLIMEYWDKRETGNLIGPETMHSMQIFRLEKGAANETDADG